MRYVVLLSVLALAGCASSKATRPGGPVTTETVRIIGPAGGGIAMTTSRTVELGVATVAAPPDRVWHLLPAVYESLGIPITHFDATKRVIGNDGFKVRRQLGTIPLTRYIDCGYTQGGPSAETYEVHLTVLTEMQPAETEGTTLATVVQAMARPVTLSGEYVRCSSTGVLESRLVNALKARLVAG